MAKPTDRKRRGNFSLVKKVRGSRKRIRASAILQGGQQTSSAGGVRERKGKLVEELSPEQRKDAAL